MNLFIPQITSRFKLTASWTFKLYYERRNRALLERMGYDYTRLKQMFPDYESGELCLVTRFPAGTELSVDRIYIKRGLQSYNSVSFRVKFKDIKGGFRFWAKLDDVNTIQADLLNPTPTINYDSATVTLFPN